LTSAQWALAGVVAALITGFGALALRDLPAMSDAVVTTTAYLSELARSARSWLGQ
jgi:hypothetical protein